MICFHLKTTGFHILSSEILTILTYLHSILSITKILQKKKKKLFLTYFNSVN